jgi:hypothetical protein
MENWHAWKGVSAATQLRDRSDHSILACNGRDWPSLQAKVNHMSRTSLLQSALTLRRDEVRTDAHSHCQVSATCERHKRGIGGANVPAQKKKFRVIELSSSSTHLRYIVL